MKNYQILVNALNHGKPFSEKLKGLHANLRGKLPMVDRIAVALYDSKTDTVKTFAHSSGGAVPLSGYEAKLSDIPSLSELVRGRSSRVINDLAELADHGSEHTRRILAAGYRASYTMPMLVENELIGFLFFNSYGQDAFSEDSIYCLDLFGQMVSMVIVNELTTLQTLVGTVQVARSFTHLRDVETLAHNDRVARYARLIANDLASDYALDDEFIEHIFLFAPLHDIGKIGIPDSILMKRGALSAEEEAVMRSHVDKGRRMVDRILKDFGLQSIRHTQILRNIVEHHHEAVDGSGYPHGIAGDQIPVETRILVVADVFDALTSARPYKPAWDNKQAFTHLRKLAGVKLDAACVAALERHQTAVVQIQARFRETE